MPTPPPLNEPLADAVRQLEAAQRDGQPIAMTHALAQMGLCYRAAGEFDTAEALLLHGLRWADMLGAVDTRIDLLCDLAEIIACAAEQSGDDAAARGLRERARGHGVEAGRLAARSADPSWEVTVLLRISDVLDRCGDHQEAITLQCRALELIECYGASAPIQGAGGAVRH